MTTLNAIVAKQLRDFKVEVDAWLKLKMKKDAIFNVLREYIKHSKMKNGYSEAWEKEEV
jgi:glutamine synthetase